MQPTNPSNYTPFIPEPIMESAHSAPIESAKTEKQLIEEENQKFKINLICQLRNIRINFLNAVRNNNETGIVDADSNHWWASQASVHQAAVEATCEAIQDAIADKQHLTIVCAGKENACASSTFNHLSKSKKISISSSNQTAKGSADVVIAPHTLYGEMDNLFKASERLLNLKNTMPIEEHPLFPYFNMLKSDGVFVATLNSGPNVTGFTELLLNKHGLETEKANRTEHINLTIFNNVETFFRVLDIFKTHFEMQTGSTIHTELSYSMPHLPLETFCKEYIKQYPELIKMNSEDLEKFIRLLSVFNVGDDIVDLNVTLKMTVKKKSESRRSFTPFYRNPEKVGIPMVSNEISMGQLDLTRQIQNLNGSEEAMIYIKDADGRVQFNAFQKIFGRQKLNIVDIGGGRGESNAVLYALKEKGSNIHLLNIEPEPSFAEPYMEAHSSRIKNVHVMQLYARQLSSQHVLDHYHGEKVDAVFASHFLYFILGDLLKASLDTEMPIEQHPLWKYFSMMRDDGVMVATMQSGAGSRLFRNALLGNHGLNPSAAPVADATVPLLSSFGNLATFLRHFEVFSEKFKLKTGKTIKVKMSHAVANVPLGKFKIDQDQETGGYVIHNPSGDDANPSWVSPTMLDFYGNWKEQQMLATLTPEKAGKMSPDELKRLRLENASKEDLAAKRETARKTQETFLHILRAFAPAEINMQHPNITLEITIS